VKFDDLKRLARGAYRISFKEFDKALEQSIGATTDYSKRCYAPFQNNPLVYMTSRSPERQGEALLDLAWAKGGEPDA
jgi:hypothetical protein